MLPMNSSGGGRIPAAAMGTGLSAGTALPGTVASASSPKVQPLVASSHGGGISGASFGGQMSAASQAAAASALMNMAMSAAGNGNGNGHGSFGGGSFLHLSSPPVSSPMDAAWQRQHQAQNAAAQRAESVGGLPHQQQPSTTGLSFPTFTTFVPSGMTASGMPAYFPQQTMLVTTSTPLYAPVAHHLGGGAAGTTSFVPITTTFTPVTFAPSIMMAGGGTGFPAASDGGAVQRKPRRKRPVPEGMGIRTGRWSPEEHRRFLEGLDQYGTTNWTAVGKLVATRTTEQVRSHAQKFFKRPLTEQEAERERAVSGRPEEGGVSASDMAQEDAASEDSDKEGEFRHGSSSGSGSQGSNGIEGVRDTRTSKSRRGSGQQPPEEKRVSTDPTGSMSGSESGGPTSSSPDVGETASSGLMGSTDSGNRDTSDNGNRDSSDSGNRDSSDNGNRDSSDNGNRDGSDNDNDSPNDNGRSSDSDSNGRSGGASRGVPNLDSEMRDVSPCS